MIVRILIVEDEYIVAADLEMKLTRMGYQVVGSAVTGEEAIRLAEESSPDLVLMDVQLHGRMKGTEAAETIRARNGIPIVFITAFAGMLPRECRDETCLGKPFSMSELKDAINAVLKKVG